MGVRLCDESLSEISLTPKFNVQFFYFFYFPPLNWAVKRVKHKAGAKFG
jgi:hypothetical protein